jgi:hypothetical protein
MKRLTWKIRISVLWIVLAVVTTAWTLQSLVVPSTIEEIMAGIWGGMQISEWFLLFFSLFWLIPLIMAVLSVTLKDAANRRTNLVLGIIFAVFYVFHPIEHIIRGMEYVGFLLFCNTVCIVIPALIAWHACKWPKEEA